MNVFKQLSKHFSDKRKNKTQRIVFSYNKPPDLTETEYLFLSYYYDKGYNFIGIGKDKISMSKTLKWKKKDTIKLLRVYTTPKFRFVKKHKTHSISKLLKFTIPNLPR